MIKLIFFDYDGVILDSNKTVHEIYQQVCGKLGLYCPSSFKEFRKIYGPDGPREAYGNFGINQENFQKTLPMFEKLQLEKDSGLYKGIEEVLKTLSSRYTLILATTNLRLGVEKKLKDCSIYHYFDAIIAREIGELSSFEKSKSMAKILTELGLDKNESVYIGDRDTDFDTADKTGINLVMVEYGWGYEKARPHELVVSKPADIVTAVSRLED